ncbi:MAG: RidA family protein [Gemmatimonadetes bacterium]|nr:RidA family protein [Gemmatimonadota bacterium]
MEALSEIATPLAPRAIGPYSQAVVADGWIFASGQIPLDPDSGEVVVGDVAEQTERVLRNLSAILIAAGGGLATVVKTTVYLADLENFSAMNQVYERYFGSRRPARATVEVSRLPRDVQVEVDAIARVG